MASRNLFGPPQNMPAIGQGQTDSSVARQLKYEEAKARRSQIPVAGKPADTLHGRQNQRDAFKRQLERDRVDAVQQRLQKNKQEEERFQQRLGPKRPSGDAPTAAYKRHNAVLNEKSRRDQAWEAKRRDYLERKRSNQNQLNLPQQLDFQRGGGGGLASEGLVAPAVMDANLRMGNNQFQASPPANQQRGSAGRRPREIIEPQIAPIHAEPLNLRNANVGGSNGPMGISNAGMIVPQQNPTPVGTDALGKHMDERQSKVQRQREYHEQLRQQAERQRRQKIESEERNKQSARNHQGLFATGGQQIVRGNANFNNQQNALPSLQGSTQDPYRPQLQQPSDMIDARKRLLQENGPSDGGNLGIGLGKSTRQMEQLKRHELRQQAQQREYERRQAEAQSQVQELQRRRAQQKMSASPAIGMPTDPMNPRKAVLQNGGLGGLHIGNGLNKPVNTGHYNTALSNLHTGAPDARELNLQKQKAAQYRAELEAQVRAKEERKAREKAAQDAEDRKYDASQYNNMQHARMQKGGRKRIAPDGSIPDTAAIVNGARPMIYPEAVPPRPIGGSDNLGRALSPTFGRSEDPGQVYQPRVGIEIAAGADFAGMPLNGGPPVHKRYRAGLKDPAEMEHLMRKRQKEAEQAAILQEQVRTNQLKKKKAIEDKKRQDALDEARIQREREELRRDHEKELAEKKHKEQREQLEQQIKEKQAMKARKEVEERLQQAKAEEKLKRDRRELQEKYDRDRGLKQSPNPKAPTAQKETLEAKRIRELEEKLRKQDEVRESQRVAELEARLKAQQDAFLKEKQDLAKQKAEVEARALQQREEVEERYRKQKATVEQQKAALAIQRSYRKNSPMKQKRRQSPQRRRGDYDYDDDSGRGRRGRRRYYNDDDETDESDVEYRRRRDRRQRGDREIGYTPRTNEKMQTLEESRQKAEDARKRAEDEASRAREEMKQLREEMEKFKLSVAQAKSPSAQEKHEQTMATVGMATVRRSNRELKKAYNQLKSKVEEQQKLIADMHKQSNGSAANFNVGGSQAAVGSDEVRRLKEQMEQMRYEMQTRDMAVEFENQRRREMEEKMDEELRMLLLDQAGVFTVGDDGNGQIGSGATGVTPRVGPGIQAISMPNAMPSPMNTERFLRGDMSMNAGSLNLDEIIAGSSAGTQVLRPPGQTMKMAGESLSSKSKFIFPDGNVAVSESAPIHSRPQATLGDAAHNVKVPPLNIDPIIPDVRDSTDSLDVTSLYERNASKIKGLEQLSANKDDDGGQEQLDQLLIDFLNQKIEPEGASATPRSAPSGSSQLVKGDTLRSDSRFVR